MSLESPTRRRPRGPGVDAVIVGSGPNGLAAAITLAEAGWSVLVVEAADRPGGGARSAPLTQPGFVHDVCSAIHPLAVGSPCLQAMPLERHGLRWIHPPLPLAHPLDDGRAVVLDRSVKVTAEALGIAADARRYRRSMMPLVDGWRELAEDVLAPPGWPRHPRLTARFGWWAIRSADALARRWFAGGDGRALLAGLGAHSCLPLERAPSAAVALVLAVAGHAVGWPMPAGGAQSIADALVSYLLELGGRLETGRPVRGLDELPEARAYLLDVTPRQLLGIARDRLTAREGRRLERWRYGPGVFKIDWALSAPIPWRAEACRRAGTIHLGGTLEDIAASERAAWAGEHAERPFVLLAQHSLFDASRAPEGHHTGWAYCHVPHGSSADMTDAIERQVERFAPGFGDLVLARSTRRCAELEQENANYVGGDITGGVTDLPQLIARPWIRRPYRTSDPAILLCSSSTPPGAGVHGMCGYHAARSLLAGA